MSAREAALAALWAVLDAALPMTVLRNAVVPETLPGAGYAALQDGSAVETVAMMSPLRFQVTQRAELILAVSGADDAARAAALDELLETAADAVIAARTLSGAAEWVQPDAPEIDYQASAGTTIVAAASLPIMIVFTAADSPTGAA